MSRKNITFLIGVAILITFILFFYFEKIIWWHLAILFIASGIFLVFLYNFDNVQKLLIQRGKDRVILEMKEVRANYYTKQKETKRIQKGMKEKVKKIKGGKILEEIIKIKIFDREYRIRLSDEEDKKYIRRLASYVDHKFNEVALKSKSVDSHKIAVLAALNIADEYFLVKSGNKIQKK